MSNHYTISRTSPEIIEEKCERFMRTELEKEDEPRAETLAASRELHRRKCAEVEAEIRSVLQQEPSVQREERLILLRAKRDLSYWRTFRINDLLPETLTHIFRLVLSSSHETPRKIVRSRLDLTWVCRHWRISAITDQTMWNVIWFRDPPPYRRSLCWFDRAGTTPLDLRINEQHAEWQGVEDVHRFTADDMNKLLTKLFTKFSQLRTLIITVDNWPPALVVLDRLRQEGIKGSRIRLERFELHRAGKPYLWIGPGFTPEVHRRPIPFCGGRASTLTHFTLNGVHIDWSTSSFSNLTTIDIRRMALEVCPTPQEFYALLASSPRLYKLCLDGAGPQYDPAYRSYIKPVTLSYLGFLTMGDFSCSYARYTLSYFTAPNVRDLTLMNMSGEDYSPFLLDMTGGFKEVRSLTMYTFEVDALPPARSAIVRWLHAMPHVNYFRISHIPNHLLYSFIESPSRHGIPQDPKSAAAQPLCPELACLEFQMMQSDAIFLFCQARIKLGVPLHMIFVNYPWSQHMLRADVTKLRSLVTLRVAPNGSGTEE